MPCLDRVTDEENRDFLNRMTAKLITTHCNCSQVSSLLQTVDIQWCDCLRSKPIRAWIYFIFTLLSFAAPRGNIVMTRSDEFREFKKIYPGFSRFFYWNFGFWISYLNFEVTGYSGSELHPNVVFIRSFVSFVSYRPWRELLSPKRPAKGRDGAGSSVIDKSLAPWCPLSRTVAKAPVRRCRVWG